MIYSQKPGINKPGFFSLPYISLNFYLTKLRIEIKSASLDSFCLEKLPFTV